MNKQQIHADKGLFALCLWREARGETLAVQTAIAWVILSRAMDPRWWGKDVMGVITQPLQFSSITDPHDKQITTWPKTDDKSWQQCLDIACLAVDGQLGANPMPGADHYYDISMPTAPKWADPSKFVGQLGRVRFYDLQKETVKST